MIIAILAAAIAFGFAMGVVAAEIQWRRARRRWAREEAQAKLLRDLGGPDSVIRWVEDGLRSRIVPLPPDLEPIDTGLTTGSVSYHVPRCVVGDRIIDERIDETFDVMRGDQPDIVKLIAELQRIAPPNAIDKTHVVPIA